MNEILMEGTSVMCVGMGTVFTFLCILIFAMTVMSKVVAKLNTIFPEPVAQVAGGKSGGKSGGKLGGKKSASNDEEIAVAILSAMVKQ